jgi:hypothetical protein
LSNSFRLERYEEAPPVSGGVCAPQDDSAFGLSVQKEPTPEFIWFGGYNLHTSERIESPWQIGISWA